MDEKIILPPGFRFCPSDQELISCYLKPKILGQKLVCNIIRSKELYGPKSTLWELFDVNDANSWTGSPVTSSEKYLYVFTALSKIRASESVKQKRIRENTCKKAGCGTWDAKTKRKPIMDCQDNVIGEQRMLLFKIDDTGDKFNLSKAGHFRMHEYSLAGINKGLKSASGGDVVLCKITFDSSKDPIFSRGPETTNGSQEFDDFGWDSNFTESFMAMLNSNPEEGAVENHVFSSGYKTTDREETENLTSTSVAEMKSGVAENTESTERLTSEKVFVKDSGLADLIADLFDDDSHEFNDFGWDSSFTDTFMTMLNSNQENSFMAMLNSNTEEGAVEDITKLGKRKFEEENMYGSKRICP